MKAPSTRSPWPWSALLIVLAGFAVFPACVLSYGTRAPKPPATTVAEGPAREHGGQHLKVAPGEDPRGRAIAALTTLGWTPSASARSDEVLATLHDNRAVVRWSTGGWWVWVEQHSDFATGEQVPIWDHPWEALRLLHLVAPTAGPVQGWSTWSADSTAVSLQGEAAELRLCEVIAATPSSFKVHEGWSFIVHLQTGALTREVFERRLRATWAASQRRGELDLNESPIITVLIRQADVILWRAAREHLDPYTWFPATVRFQGLGHPGTAADEHLVADEVMRALCQVLAVERAVAAGKEVPAWRRVDRAPLLYDRGIAILRRFQVPSWEELPDPPPSMAEVTPRFRRFDQQRIVTAWWNAHGRAWLRDLSENQP